MRTICNHCLLLSHWYKLIWRLNITVSCTKSLCLQILLLRFILCHRKSMVSAHLLIHLEDIAWWLVESDCSSIHLDWLIGMDTWSGSEVLTLCITDGWFIQNRNWRRLNCMSKQCLLLHFLKLLHFNSLRIEIYKIWIY